MKTRWQSIAHTSGLAGEWLDRVGCSPGAIVSDDSMRRFLTRSAPPNPEPYRIGRDCDRALDAPVSAAIALWMLR